MELYIHPPPQCSGEEDSEPVKALDSGSGSEFCVILVGLVSTASKEVPSSLGMSWAGEAARKCGPVVHRAVRSVLTRRARTAVQPSLTLQEEAEMSSCWVP